MSWSTGIRAVANGGGVVEADEIKRILQIILDGGDIGEEMRRNAKKWRDLTREAAEDGGSSNTKLKAFLEVAEAVVFLKLVSSILNI